MRNKIPDTRYKIRDTGSEVGQSLMEVLVALALAGLIIGLITAVIFSSLQSGERARVQATASRLAFEMMESAAAVASGDWHKIYCPPAGEGSGDCAGQKGGANFYYATSTLAAHWPMDEGSGSFVGDKSGSGFIGTANGTTIVDGKYYKARQFNGLTDYVGVPHNQLLEPSSVTVEAWVNLSNKGTRHLIVTKWQGYTLEVGSDGRPSFQIHNNEGQVGATASEAIPWNTWTHLAGTFDDASRAINIYVNGEEKGSAILFSGIIYDHQPLKISDCAFTCAQGVIDEVRVFSRALPPYEITEHYLHPADVISKTPVIGRDPLDFAGNIYTRYFTVDNVSRDPATQAIESSFDPAHDDPSTQLITVHVAASRFFASSSISQYVTRHDSEVFVQQNWSCGLLGETPPPGQICGYASSTNVVSGYTLRLPSLLVILTDIDPVYSSAWNDTIGWIDFYSTNNVNVFKDRLEGYATSSVGYIALNCNSTPNGNICAASNFKVSNDGNGVLSGWAYNDGTGWISFNCSNIANCDTSDYKVTIDESTGEWHGWAYSDTIGWISFNCANTDSCAASDYKVASY